MNYIYNTKRINDNYMFHNKELSNGDIVWGYEPKGKKLYNYSVDYSDNKPSEYGSIYEGTGTVTKKYKVVEVYMHLEINYPDREHHEYDIIGLGNEEYEKLITTSAYDDKNIYLTNYAYKLEKISDVSMELSEFQSIKKIFVGYQTEYGEFIPKEHYRRDYDELDRRGLSKTSCYDYEFKPLTRYNKLTQVILRRK